MTALGTSIERRVERLESAAGYRDEPTCIVVTGSPDETMDAAVARYRAEIPDIPENANFIVGVTGFSRAPGDPLP
jgi:hypothetical protein